MTDTSNDVTPKSKRNVEIFYIDSKGARAARPQPDVVSFGKKFLESGEELIWDLKRFEAVGAQGLAFGLQQVTQNAYGGLTTDAERIEACEDRIATLEGGSWSSERQAGPRDSDLLDAWAAAREEQGAKADAEWRESVRQKLEAGEVTSKQLMANARIKAKLDAIRAQRAADRAKASAEKLASAPEASDGLLD